MEGRDAPFFDRVLSKRGTFQGRTDNMRKRHEGMHYANYEKSQFNNLFS